MKGCSTDCTFITVKWGSKSPLQTEITIQPVISYCFAPSILNLLGSNQPASKCFVAARLWRNKRKELFCCDENWVITNQACNAIQVGLLFTSKEPKKRDYMMKTMTLSKHSVICLLDQVLLNQVAHLI